MSVPQRAGSAAIGRRRSPIWRRVQALAAAALALAATACAQVPSTPYAGRDPSDPSARVKGVGCRSTIAPYASQRPAEPAPWRASGEPAAKP